MKARLIGAALLALVSFPALASEACNREIPVDVGLAALEAMGATRIEFLQGAARDRAVAHYNAVPPVTDRMWDIVVIADLPTGGFAAVGTAGLICDRAAFSADQWIELRRLFVGTDA